MNFYFERKVRVDPTAEFAELLKRSVLNECPITLFAMHQTIGVSAPEFHSMTLIDGELIASGQPERMADE